MCRVSKNDEHIYFVRKSAKRIGKVLFALFSIPFFGCILFPGLHNCLHFPGLCRKAKRLPFIGFYNNQCFSVKSVDIACIGKFGCTCVRRIPVVHTNDFSVSLNGKNNVFVIGVGKIPCIVFNFHCEIVELIVVV